MKEISAIASRLRELREVSDYTVEEFAEEFNIAPEVYAKYEENGIDIPISLIFEIANKFKVDFNEIVTGVPARLNSYHIVKRGDGKVVNRNPDYHFEDLAYKYFGKVMQPLLVTLDPSANAAKLIAHTGQEFNMVLEGTVVVTYDGEDFVLNAGDTIYFNATKPHGQRCGGESKARFLTIIAE